MLKMLQQEVNLRTEALDELRRRKVELTPEQDAELTRLEDDQRNIIDIALDLTKPREEDALEE